MSVIFKIAKNEWRYLFYSPIAWFVMIVFFVQCAFYYTNALYSMANWSDIMLQNSPGFKDLGTSLTSGVFLRGGIYLNVMMNLYLFIPVLTMGLINRELQSGSVKLLYASPVTVRQIVVGKYLGIMLYNLLLVGILGIFMITAAFNIRQVDYAMLLSAALGFYLLICAYSAIGLFMSSLSAYQVVAAVSTFLIIFGLSRIGGLWQRYDIVRDLTYFLSLQNRTAKMLSGLILTRDVIYFVLISCMFVAFTIIRLRSGREARPWYIRAGRYMIVAATVLAAGYISSRPSLTGYWDTTATKFNTIPKRMQQIIREFGDSTLEVTLYVNLLGGQLERVMPEARNTEYMAVMWEPYLRFKPDIKFKYEYYYDAPGTDSALYRSYPGKNLRQIAMGVAEAVDADLSMFRPPEQMRQIIDLRKEGCRHIIRLRYKGRTEFLRTFNDPFFWPDLTNVAAGFKRLLEPEKIPKTYFISGGLERSIYKTGDREYAGHSALKTGRGTLVNIGYDVDTLNLAMQHLPANVTAVVLADPKTALSPAVQHTLKNYLDSGGNMFILGEPGKQQVLNPFLKELGIQLMDGQLVQPSYDETPEKIIAHTTVAYHRLFEGVPGIKTDTGGERPFLFMPGVSAIAGNGHSSFAVKPLAMTDGGETWLKAGTLVPDSTLPPPNSAAGDIRADEFTTAVMLTRRVQQKEQRVIVCGDADFASNLRLKNSYSPLLAFYRWLNHTQFPLPMPRPDPKDTLLTITGPQAAAQKTIYVWVLPGLLLLAATILLIRRKRK